MKVQRWGGLNRKLPGLSVEQDPDEGCPVKRIGDSDIEAQAISPHGHHRSFMQCEVIGGEFISNIETTGFDYFNIDELPCLAEEKDNREQIEMCFQAMHSETWEALYD